MTGAVAISLFVGYSEVFPSAATTPLPIALLVAASAGTVVLGNLRPGLISFLPSMRYYAGNWDTTMWCITPAAADKINRGVVKLAEMPHAQFERLHGAGNTEIPNSLGQAFRAMNTHWRALYTLIHRAVPEGHDADYLIVDGEAIGGAMLGWNFGCGHLRSEQLLESLHRRCRFDPGEVRVVMLHGQPIHKQIQVYRLVDGATGEFERGHVAVQDLVSRQPWADDVPVHVHRRAADVHKTCRT